ncbi:MAG: hypothetical protein M1485_05965 [Chloroflexi bacterium]|nr:hypothetical protein [Chloroflexota bacterium]
MIATLRGEIIQIEDNALVVEVGAVARHLAEAAYWMLRKHEPYRESTSDLPKQA